MVSGKLLTDLFKSQSGSQEITAMLKRMALEIAESGEVPAYCNEIIVFLLKHWKEFVSDPNACRICQVIFKEPMYWRQRDYIIDNEIMDHIVQLSQEKYGSHIIETAIKYSSPIYLTKIFNEILYGYKPLRDPEANAGAPPLSALEVLMFDQYGNYVFQHLYRAAEEVRDFIRPGDRRWLSMLDNTIKRNRQKLRRLTHGKQILKSKHLEK
ncbi:PUM-HD domain-containing protein [Aphelenchoides besseyi]|nr:PUM-HD domain-containing protein [Aphelenchoides besseyi]KAI6212005.1 PUM-HD domain-containing protein [Aphelenchoides besseyi]